MLWAAGADLVVVIHFAFLAFVAGGSMMARRWPQVVWLHLPAVAWALASVTAGLPCPLTELERGLLARAGEPVPVAGFVDRYVEGTLFPEAASPLLQAGVALVIVVGYCQLVRRRQLPGLTRHWS